MLKKIQKAICKRLLKIDWVKLEIEAYRLLQDKKRYHEHWARLMHSGGAVRDGEPVETHKTLVTVCDSEVVVEYMDGRIVGQRHVAPLFIDTTNWGVDRDTKDIKRHGTDTDCSNVSGTEKCD